VIYLVNVATTLSSELWEHIREEQFNQCFHQIVSCCATLLAVFSTSDVYNELMEHDITLLKVHTVCGKLWATKLLGIRISGFPDYSGSFVVALQHPNSGKETVRVVIHATVTLLKRSVACCS
jgi:hypothetical protein